MTDMKPGPELDALVAEKVCGWVWRRSEETGRRCLYPPDRWPFWMSMPADGTEEIVRDVAEGMVPLLPVSTDLTTCERAAEEARKAGKIVAWGVEYAQPPARHYEYTSHVRTGWDEAERYSGASHEGAAHALALALLKACGS